MSDPRAALDHALDALDAAMLNIAAIGNNNPGNPSGTTPATVQIAQAPSFNMIVGGSDVTLSSIVRNALGGTIAGATVTWTSDNTGVATVNSSTGVVHAVSAAATVIGSDTFTRSDSASTLGTAETGGAWTAQAGTWGITGGKAYAASNTDGNTATLTFASPPSSISAVLTTDAIDTHGWCVVPRYADANNCLRVWFNTHNPGSVQVQTIIAGVGANVMTSPTTVLPTSGAASFTALVTIDPVTNVVRCYVDGVQAGTDYTLTSSALSAFGSSATAGFRYSFHSGTATAATIDTVQFKGVSQATITATSSNGKTGTAIVLVSADTTPAQIVMTPNAITIGVGDPDVNVSSTITNQAGTVLTGEVATYTTSDATIFTVGASSGTVHPVAAGSGILTATTSNGKFDTTAVTVTSTTPSTRTMLFPDSASVRLIAREPSRSNATDRAFINAHFDHIEDTGSNGSLAGHPNAISSQTYGLLAKMEVDGGAVFSSGAWSAAHDDRNAAVAATDFSAAYATANSLNDEDFWIHSRSGDQNYACGITTITAAGAVSFNNPFLAGLVTSFPFTVGQTVTLSGLSVGNGTYVIASLQQFGVTLTGWSAGDLALGATPGQSKIGTLYVPGDGTATKSNRKWIFYFSEWRNVPWFNNAGCRAMHAARFTKILANSGNPINGVLIDEMDSSWYTSATVQSVEYGTTGGTPFAGPVCPFSTDMAACLTAIRTANPGIYLRANTAAFTFPCDKQIALAAGGVHAEQLLSIFTTDTSMLDYYVTLVGQGVDVEFVDGGTWKTAAQNGGVTPVPGLFFGPNATYIPGNYGSSSQRRQLASYCLYLLGVDATRTLGDGTKQKHAIIDLTNSNSSDIPVSSRWTPAFEYPIGQPTGAYVHTATIAPPSGSGVRVYSRTFSKDSGATTSAIAYISLCSGSPGTLVYDDTSLVTVTLPTPPPNDAWYMLNWDGTLGTTPLTTLNIRRAEGVIVVAAPAGTIAQRADSFVKSVGVNIHQNADPTNAHFPDIVLPAVQDIGVQSIRSGTTTDTASLARTQLCYTEAGAQSILVMEKPGTYTDTSAVDAALANVDSAAIIALEGPNEVDNNATQWGDGTYAQMSTNVRTFIGAVQSDVAANGDPLIRAIPLTTPTVTSSGGAAGLGDCSSFATIGAVHPYPIGGVEPGAGLAASIANIKPVFAELSRVFATETGYETAPNQTGESYLIGQGLSEVAQQKYLPRLFAEYFSQGVERTFSYDFINDGNNYPALTDGESNFGWIRYDGTYKAVATTIKNMLAILGETTWTLPSGSVGTAYIDDTFVRSNQTEWGTATSGADTGKTWTPDGSGRHSIVSNAGVVTPTFQTNTVIGDSHSGDVEIYVEARNVRANYTNRVRVYGRWVDLSHNYSFDYIPTVTNPISINKNSVAIQLGLSSNTSYNSLVNPNIRFWIQTKGSDVYMRARIWDSALTEPTKWDVYAIDKNPASGYLAGKFAFWGDNNSSGQQMKLTRFRAAPLTVTNGARSALGALTLGRLLYSYTGAPSTLKDCLLQKADGSFFLLVWNRISSWNAGSKTDITNAPVSMSITFPTTHTVAQYTPSAGQSPTTLATSATSATFNLTDEVTILHIT